ncbi:F-box protein [Musa troglodytarum]|uniref:F-box protein n=1 Tax=Musa troglodytarum TaxID=320322 RepID=A0A9E7JC41_9LILI|nr:F-box protein [Musa troglodytarum]
MADHVPRIAMWAGLRQHLVKLTSRFLRNASDYIRFRAVCKSWRSAVPPRPRHLPTQLPFLLYLSTPEPRNSSAFCLADAFNGSMRRLPHTTSMYCIGSSYGWLILICETSSDVSLFNPITAEEISLPSLSTLPADVLISSPQSEDGSDAIVDKAVLSSDPTLDGDFAAIVFLNGVHKKCFSCRPGDASWRANANGPILDLYFFAPEMLFLFRLADVVPYGKRRLCAVHDDNENLGIFDVDPGPPGRVTMIACNVMPISVPQSRFPTYLVPSAGELMLVSGCSERTADGRDIESFRVFWLDPGDWNRDAEAVEVDDIHLIRDRIFFLGTSHSASVDARDYPGFEGNTTYFVYQDKVIEEEENSVFGIGFLSLGDVADSNQAEGQRFEWRSDVSDATWWVSPNLRSRCE